MTCKIIDTMNDIVIRDDLCWTINSFPSVCCYEREKLLVLKITHEKTVVKRYWKSIVGSEGSGRYQAGVGSGEGDREGGGKKKVIATDLCRFKYSNT
jgi:hypothetical protein